MLFFKFETQDYHCSQMYQLIHRFFSKLWPGNCYLHRVPEDIIMSVVADLDLIDVIYFSMTNKRYRNLIYHNNLFWSLRFSRQFPDSRVAGTINRKQYMKYNGIWSITLNDNKPQQFAPVVGQYVGAGWTHFYAMDIDSNLYLFGSNTYNQLGVARSEPKSIRYPVPVKMAAVGLEYTMIIEQNDQVCLFGQNSHNKFGQADDITMYYSTVKYYRPGIRANL